MEEKERLLDVKKNLNKKRPNFLRREYHRRLKLRRTGWRKPKGIHSKTRERRVGKPKNVAVGYRGPAAVRGLTKEGKLIVMLKSISDLQKFNPEKEAAIIARTLGMKKKYEIVKKAVDKNIIFLNLKNPKKFLTDVEDDLKTRKEERKKRAEKKAAKPKKEEKPKPKETEPKEEPKKEVKPVQKPSAATEYAKKMYEEAKPAPKAEKVPTALDLAKAKEKAKGDK